ncbi:MAG: fibronectin type III domain-containing protein [Desulfobacteraceae bacterium]|nr:fibronectin type III domain-containing protein [Desulfobacteraceae bacterium]
MANRFFHYMIVLCVFIFAACDSEDQEKTPQPPAKDHTGLIQPEHALSYLGAFRLPDERGEDPAAKWNGGGRGMTYYPKGDSHGPDDGYPGSLFSISHTYANHVSEFSIPAPVVSDTKDLDDLPQATTLQPFSDITEGRQTLGLTGTTLVDIQYYPKQGSQSTDKLYWTLYEYYLPQFEDPYHGWAELDLSAPQSQGLWRLGDFPSSATSKYLFDVPGPWADTFTPGKYLAGGRFRSPNNGSCGPALYVFGPWNDGNPPSDGSSLDAVELLKYGTETNVRGFTHNDDWVDGAWLTVGEKSAVMIAGKRGLRTKDSNLETYGGPQPDDYSKYKGYHACPDYGAMLFYDPVLLSYVAQGDLSPGEVQPYAVLNVQDILFTTNMDLSVQSIRTRGKSLAGVGYDRDNNLLYVLEKNVEGYYSPGKPIVHVFKVRDSDEPADLVPPSPPVNLSASSVTSDEVTFTWDPVTDNHHLSGYIIHRNGFPIDTSVTTSYTDDRVNPGNTYDYTVVAWDARDNRSLPSAPLSVATLSGTDSRIPLITDIYLTDITESSAVVHWKTDEPANGKIDYGAQYHVDKEVSDPGFTTTHALTLTDLTDAPSYGLYVYAITCTDESGNVNEYPKKSFKTAKASADNQTPVLSGIGAKRISADSLIQFTIQATDHDHGDTLVYLAENLPESAAFDNGTGLFQWLPDSSDAGIHRVLFSVSDGDQTDSEEVAIIVE